MSANLRTGQVAARAQCSSGKVRRSAKKGRLHVSGWGKGVGFARWPTRRFAEADVEAWIATGGHEDQRRRGSASWLKRNAPKIAAMRAGLVRRIGEDMVKRWEARGWLATVETAWLRDQRASEESA